MKVREHTAQIGVRSARVAVVVTLFAIVTWFRFATSEQDSDGLTLLYAVPIALLAVTFGVRGGVTGACIGLALYATWATVKDIDVSAVDYVARATAIFAFGGLGGLLSERQAEVGRANTRWFEMSNDLLVEADLRGNFTRLNDQWERCLGWTRAEMIARPMLDFVHPDDLEATAAIAASLDARPGEVVNFENRYRTKDGSYRWLLWNSRSDGHRKYAVARDITERKGLEQERQSLFDRVEAMARTDALTGLPNRRAWEEALQQAMTRAKRSGQPLALAMVDLDHLKDYNDTRGHQAGDALLAEAATNWRRALRASDYLARYGGDEFALLLPGCSPGAALWLLDRVRTATPQGQACSIGLAHWDHDESPEALLARADAALYAAKDGRGRVVAAGAESG